MDLDRHVQAAVRDALDASLSTLDQRERIVMRMRYGLDDGMPRTLEDIGKYFKVGWPSVICYMSHAARLCLSEVMRQSFAGQLCVCQHDLACTFV